MVPKKRTYSTIDKKRGMREQDERRKRSKSDEDDNLHWPGGHQSSRPLESSSLLKKGLKKFGGPVSFPNDEEDSEIALKNTSRLSVLDRALGGKLKLSQPKQNSIYGSREDFEKTIQVQSAKKSSDERTTPSYLPTPPGEVQKPQKQLTNRFIPSVKEYVANLPTQVTTPAWRPSPKSKMSEKIPAYHEPRQPYVPKQFEADRSLAPRTNLTGGRLSSKSKEAKLWSINQSDSSFLRLPAEIRNRIYEYTLGSQTIKIGYETFRSTLKKEKPVFRYNCTVFSHSTNPFKADQQPYVRISTKFTLLNNVCRQLYLETAVLPYKLSKFAFDSHNIMVNFLLHEQRLSRQQRHALTKLLVRNDLPGANMLTFLPNLEKVLIDSKQVLTWYTVIRAEGEEPKLQRRYRS